MEEIDNLPEEVHKSGLAAIAVAAFGGCVRAEVCVANITTTVAAIIAVSEWCY